MHSIIKAMVDACLCVSWRPGGDGVAIPPVSAGPWVDSPAHRAFHSSPCSIARCLPLSSLGRRPASSDTFPSSRPSIRRRAPCEEGHGLAASGDSDHVPAGGYPGHHQGAAFVLQSGPGRGASVAQAGLPSAISAMQRCLTWAGLAKPHACQPRAKCRC